MIKKVFLTIILLINLTTFAQDDIHKTSAKKVDTTSMLPNNNFREEKQISIRIGAGLQKSFYSEFGVALHTCTYGDTGYFSKAYYLALEWVPDKIDDIYSLKVGYETSALLVNLGLEMKYQTDFKTNDVVITPKIGFGIFGDLNISYGYNISTNSNPFSGIGNHQFSIIFNLNKHFLSYQ